MKITCGKCGKRIDVPVTLKEIENWVNSGKFIQDYFPNLTAAERELILSNICNDCWNKLFPEEDELFYFVKFDNEAQIYDEEQLKNFVETAVIHNKDIADFHVIALDSRLKESQARCIADAFHLYDEVDMEITKGSTPYEAILEWVLK